jgi:hypothetical protein
MILGKFKGGAGIDNAVSFEKVRVEGYGCRNDVFLLVAADYKKWRALW